MEGKAEGFIYAVSEMGLPRDLCRGPGGRSNIVGLKAEDIAKCYWTLKEVRVVYRVELGGVVERREWNLACEIDPRERVHAVPHMSAEGDQGIWTGRMEWNLGNVTEVGEGEYGMQVSLAERDGNRRNLIMLGGKAPKKYRVLDMKYLEICGKKVPLRLLSKDEGATGRIVEAEAVETYWDF